MKAIENQEYIDDYLSNKLEGEGLEKFEEALKSNPDLAKRVQTIRQMEKALGNRAKNEFRESLKEVGGGRKKGKSFLLLAIIIVIGTVATCIFIWNLNDTPKPSPNTQEQSLEIETSNVEDVESTSPLPEDTDDTEPAKDNEIENESPPKTNRPIASVDESLFQQMEFLETVMKEQLRTEDNVEFIFPGYDYIFKQGDTKTEIEIFGSLKKYDAEEIELFIYNNNEADFNENEFVLKETLSIQEDGQIKRFIFTRSVDFQPGLYYFLLQPPTSRSILYVGKFRVK